LTVSGPDFFFQKKEIKDLLRILALLFITNQVIEWVVERNAKVNSIPIVRKSAIIFGKWIRIPPDFGYLLLKKNSK